jgi:hypothetical protein
LRLCHRAVLFDQRGDFIERLLLLMGLPIKGTADDRQHRDHRSHCPAQAVLPPPRSLGTAKNVIRAKPGQAGDDLGEGEVLANSRLTRVGTKDSDRPVGDAAVTGKLEAQSRRKISLDRWCTTYEKAMSG